MQSRPKFSLYSNAAGMCKKRTTGRHSYMVQLTPGGDADDSKCLSRSTLHDWLPTAGWSTGEVVPGEQISPAPGASPPPPAAACRCIWRRCRADVVFLPDLFGARGFQTAFWPRSIASAASAAECQMTSMSVTPSVINASMSTRGTRLTVSWPRISFPGTADLSSTTVKGSGTSTDAMDSVFPVDALDEVLSVVFPVDALDELFSVIDDDWLAVFFSWRLFLYADNAELTQYIHSASCRIVNVDNTCI